MSTRGDEHVIGTNESDLLQIYTGKVKFLGNLHVQNINFSPFSKTIIGEKEFYPNIAQHYWLKSQNQVRIFLKLVFLKFTRTTLFTPTVVRFIELLKVKDEVVLKYVIDYVSNDDFTLFAIIKCRLNKNSNNQNIVTIS